MQEARGKHRIGEGERWGAGGRGEAMASDLTLTPELQLQPHSLLSSPRPSHALVFKSKTRGIFPPHVGLGERTSF